MDCSLLGSFVHGVLQARIPEWVASSLLQGIFTTPGIQPRSPTLQVDSVPSEPPGKPTSQVPDHCFPPCPICNLPNQSCIEGLSIPGYLPLSGKLFQGRLGQAWGMLTAAQAQNGNGAHLRRKAAESPRPPRKAPVWSWYSRSCICPHSPTFSESHSRKSHWYSTESIHIPYCSSSKFTAHFILGKFFKKKIIVWPHPP